MQKEYELLIRGMKANIWRQPVEPEELQEIDWDKWLKLVYKHNVEAMVYSSMNNPEITKQIEKDKLEEWKKRVFKGSVTQINCTKETQRIISLLQNQEVQVVVLKGMVLRNLYPRPEHRTMGDVDILVPPQCMGQVRETLEQEGYASDHKTEMHEVFFKAGKLPIEVHWKLLHSLDNHTSQNEEQAMWEGLEEVYVGGVQTYTLGINNQIIYQILHMVRHMWGSGFGIRQLCDIALLLRQHKEEIDWQLVGEKARQHHIEQFLKVVCVTCQRIWKIPISDFYIKEEDISQELVDQFLIYMLENGVHKKQEYTTNDMVVDTLLKAKYRSVLSLVTLMFPIREDFLKKYKYAERCKLLIPIAWLHRLIKIQRDYWKNKHLLRESMKEYNNKQVLLSRLGITQ